MYMVKSKQLLSIAGVFVAPTGVKSLFSRPFGSGLDINRGEGNESESSTLSFYLMLQGVPKNTKVIFLIFSN